jgi:polysaccharide biosynthesis/export protein
MPGRSKGRLLAGTGAVLALCVAGPGCQTQSIRPATIGPVTPAVAVAAPDTPAVVPAATPPAPVVVAASHPAPARFSFFRRARPAVEMQAPVAQSADHQADASQGMAVIASSWRSIDQANPAPAVPAGAPAVLAGSAAPAVPTGPAVPSVQALPPAPTGDGALQQTDAKVPEAQTTDSPWRQSVVAASSQTTPAAATPDQSSTPPAAMIAAPVEPVPSGRLVPQAVPTDAAPVIARAHYHYPSSAHPAAVAPPVPAVPREFEKQSLPPYVVEPPDILLIVASAAITLPTQPLQGQHLVRPDGTINLGIYGSVYVAGLTLDQIQDVVASVLKARHARKLGNDFKTAEGEMTVEEIKKELQVDVLAYNSKVYYIITDGGGYGEQVYRISATGNETVLDALSQINGLPAVASKKRIWVARATPDHAPPMILPVDWCGIVRNGSAATNYQIFPGDRIYVNSDALIRTDSRLGKFLAPVERVLGTVLLGSSTVNSIKSGSLNNGTGVP